MQRWSFRKRPFQAPASLSIIRVRAVLLLLPETANHHCVADQVVQAPPVLPEQHHQEDEPQRQVGRDGSQQVPARARTKPTLLPSVLTTYRPKARLPTVVAK